MLNGLSLPLDTLTSQNPKSSNAPCLINKTQFVALPISALSGKDRFPTKAVES